ncbi:unnamed protein product [Citrullus colocynthis]|uniref:Uncharacterized protein n=1 Tax=Citrullus colocynthis TaxID=252529 RepID=A0ABP0ZBB8_9ROSI
MGKISLAVVELKRKKKRKNKNEEQNLFGDSNSTTLRRIKQDRIGLSLSKDSTSSPVNLKFATYDEKSLKAGRLAGVQLLLLRSLCFTFKSFLLFLFFCNFIRNSLFLLQILTILGLLSLPRSQRMEFWNN